ncbi:MAG: hypothetical protein RBJ76_06865 [Stenomitos frigidus ULC029]
MPTLLEWQQINSFGIWLSAGGSIFASCVALYLARQSNVEKLKIDYAFGSNADRKKVLEVTLTNAGIRPVTLKLCSIHTPRVARTGGGIGGNVKLQYGEYYELQFPMESLLEYSNHQTVIEVDTTTKRFIRRLPRKTLELGNSIRIESDTTSYGE